MWPSERRETLGAVWGKKRAPCSKGRLASLGWRCCLKRRLGKGGDGVWLCNGLNPRLPSLFLNYHVQH